MRVGPDQTTRRCGGLVSKGTSIQLRRSRFWFQFPKDIDDLPVAVEFGDLEIVDPIGSNDFHDSGVIIAIENRHFFQLSILRDLFADAFARSLHERHCSYVIELAAAGIWIGQ